VALPVKPRQPRPPFFVGADCHDCGHIGVAAEQRAAPLRGAEEDEVQVRVSDDQPEDAKITREGDSLTLTVKQGSSHRARSSRWACASAR
jgi:hypothetical protein